MKYRLPLSSLSRYATEWLLLGGVLLLVALILGLFVAQKGFVAQTPRQQVILRHE